MFGLSIWSSFDYFSLIFEYKGEKKKMAPYHTTLGGLSGFRVMKGVPGSPGESPSVPPGICGMLGIPWPDTAHAAHAAHAPPEEPYGLGSQRTLADYEGPYWTSLRGVSVR